MRTTRTPCEAWGSARAGPPRPSASAEIRDLPPRSPRQALSSATSAHRGSGGSRPGGALGLSRHRGGRRKDFGPRPGSCGVSQAQVEWRSGFFSREERGQEKSTRDLGWQDREAQGARSRGSELVGRPRTQSCVPPSVQAPPLLRGRRLQPVP